MSLRYLLDTSIVSSPISKAPNPAIVKQLERRAHECALGAPVWHELVYGCSRLARGKRREALESYLQDVVRAAFSVLAYDDRAAEWHGHERSRLEAHGQAAPFVDGQIAAIAHVNELILVTTNTRDFERFKDIELENWSLARS